MKKKEVEQSVNYATSSTFAGYDGLYKIIKSKCSFLVVT